MVSSSVVQRYSPWLLAFGLTLLSLGLLQTQVLEFLPRDRVFDYFRWAVISLPLGYLATRLLPLRLATGLGLVWLVAHIAFAGPTSFLTTALLALAALGIGDGFIRWSLRGKSANVVSPRFSPMVALIVGLGLLQALIGWLLPLPIHFGWLYAIALTTVIYVRRTAIVGALRVIAAQWQSTVSEAPRMAAITVTALGLASTATWVPTMMYDDLAYHLGLPMQLHQLGYYRMDPASQVWALAPWAGDVIQAMAQLIADRESRGSVNLLWLLSGAWLLAALSRTVGLSVSMALLAVVLYASSPITAVLMAGMQTEGPGVACLLALALLITQSERWPRGPLLMLAALLAGFILQLKVSFAVPLAIFAAWLMWEWRGKLPWRHLPLAIFIGFLIGGSSFLYSWILTGNPVLPLLNDHFQSSYYATNTYFDNRYTRGWSVDLFWRAAFYSGEIFEGWPGAGGFHNLVLAALLPLACLAKRVRGLLMVALATTLVMYAIMHYLRYIHPALILLIPALLTGLATLPWRRTALAIGLALAALNFTFHTNSSWILRDGAAGRNAQVSMRAYVPERLLMSGLDERARVITYGRPFNAELGGRGFTINWYDYALSAAGYPVTSNPSAAVIEAFFAEYGFTHVLIAGQPDIPQLAQYLVLLKATKTAELGDASIWRLSTLAPPKRDLMQDRDLAVRMHLWR